MITSRDHGGAHAKADVWSGSSGGEEEEEEEREGYGRDRRVGDIQTGGGCPEKLLP